MERQHTNSRCGYKANTDGTDAKVSFKVPANYSASPTLYKISINNNTEKIRLI